MRNNYLLLKIFPLTVLCLFSACMAAPNRDLQPAVSRAVSSTEETSNNETMPNYKMISSPDGIIYTGVAQVDNGFYELVFAKDVISGAQNIVYTDFQSLHRVFLSSDINSDHQSENDTSYLPAAVGGAGILTDGNYIYILKKGSLLLQNSYGEMAKPCIYRANLDGSNRMVLNLPFDQAISSTSGVFSDGNCLFLLIDVVHPDATNHQELICADFSAQRITTLIEFSHTDLDSQNLALVSSFEDKLVLSSLQINDEMDRFEQTLYTLDPVEETLTPLVHFSPETQYIFFQNGNIYYLELSENALYRFDPENGKSELLLPQLSPPGLAFDAVQIGNSAPEPYLAFRFTVGEDSVNYYWNRDTDEWKREKLVDGDREVHIFGIWQDYFLVMLQDKTVSYQDFTSNGQVYENQMSVTEYALISQEDYWDGTPNYLRISDDVYGS